jgi:LruC domain-containing protein
VQIEVLIGGIMLKILKFLPLIFLLVVFGCSTDNVIKSSEAAQKLTELEIPEGFDWDFTQEVAVSIFARDSNGIGVAGKPISLYQTENNQLFELNTDSFGRIEMNVTMPESSTTVYIEHDGIRHSVPVSGSAVDYTFITEPERDIRANGTVFVPGQNSVMTLLFEDNWPNMGDYDFNDMVIEAWGKLRFESDYLRFIELQATVVASGATFHNGFEAMFETTAFPDEGLGDQITITAFDSDGNQLFANSADVTAAYGTELLIDDIENQMTFKFFDNIYDVISLPQGYLAVNTLPSAPWKGAITIKFRIDYVQLILYNSSVFDLNSLNPYIVVDGVAGFEVHLPGYPYTSNFTQYGLFGTGDDATPIGGIASPLYDSMGFRTAEGFSWGLKLEGRLEYPREQADIVLAYPELADYFAGNQPLFDNWWQPHPDSDYSEGYILDRGDLTWEEQNEPVGD